MPQACGRSPERGGNPDPVTRTGAAAKDRLTVKPSGDRHAHDHLTACAQVSADHVATELDRGLHDAFVELLQLIWPEPYDAHEGLGGAAAHGGYVAQVDGHRLPPEVRQRRERQVGIDAGNQRVRREQEERRFAGRRDGHLDDRRVVAGPHFALRRPRQEPDQPGNRLVLTASGTCYIRDSSSAFLAANSCRLMTPLLRRSSSWLSWSATLGSRGPAGASVADTPAKGAALGRPPARHDASEGTAGSVPGALPDVPAPLGAAQ